MEVGGGKERKNFQRFEEQRGGDKITVKYGVMHGVSLISTMRMAKLINILQ